MVDGVNQQPGLFQRIGNFFGAGDPNAGQRTGTPFFPDDPNANQPTDPFAGLSRAQRTMLGFAALRDAAASLEGRDSNFFQSALGGFEQARERERLRTQGMLQNLANIEQQIAIAQFTGIPVSQAMLQMRDMLTQQLAPTAPTLTAGAAPVTGATPTSGAMPSMPGAIAPATRPATGGAVMDATGAVIGDVADEPLSPAAQAAIAGEPTPAPASDIDARIAAQQQRQLELLEDIDVQGRGAQGLGLPANTAALEAELRIVNDEINRLRDQKAAAEAAVLEETAQEERRGEISSRMAPLVNNALSFLTDENGEIRANTSLIASQSGFAAGLLPGVSAADARLARSAIEELAAIAGMSGVAEARASGFGGSLSDADILMIQRSQGIFDLTQPEATVQTLRRLQSEMSANNDSQQNGEVVTLSDGTQVRIRVRD